MSAKGDCHRRRWPLATRNVWRQLAGLLGRVIAGNCASQDVMHFELLHAAASAAAAAEVIELHCSCEVWNYPFVPCECDR